MMITARMARPSAIHPHGVLLEEDDSVEVVVVFVGVVVTVVAVVWVSVTVSGSAVVVGSVGVVAVVSVAVVSVCAASLPDAVDGASAKPATATADSSTPINASLASTMGSGRTYAAAFPGSIDRSLLRFPSAAERRKLTRVILARILVAWGINALALWVANILFDGVSIHGWWAYIIGAGVLGLANAILKPILAILTLPLIVFTLGIFYLLINIAMVALAEWIAPNFSIDGFWTYVGVVVIVWAVNWIANTLADEVESPRRVLA
jgi:putative membrane protein